ncbi:copia protein [Tanacetum coccineum]
MAKIQLSGSIPENLGTSNRIDRDHNISCNSDRNASFATKRGKGASENLGGRPLKSILNKTTYSPPVIINANIMLRRLLAGVKNDLGAGNMSTTYELSGGMEKPIVDDPQTHGVDRQHDGMHSPPTFASFLHKSSQRNVNFRTLEIEQTELVDVLILISSVLEVHARFKNTLYSYGDKNGFFFIHISYATGLEEVLEQGPWLIQNALFILRKWTLSSKLSKRELNYVHMWIKFHGVHVSSFTTDGLSAILTHLGTPIMKGVHDLLVSKHKTGGNHSISNQQVPKLAYEKKMTSTPMSNAFFALEEDNEKHIDDLFNDIRKKARAPPRKTGIWSGSLVDTSLVSGFTSPNPFDFLTKEDGKSILRDLQESDDDVDLENGYDETVSSSKSLDSQMHNNIMAAGSRDRPPMLATGRYAHQPIIDECTVVLERTIPETFLNITPENKDHYDAEKEFLQQLQPEWSRFVTIVKQTQYLDKESYHKLFDILKQYQKEVNEIYAKKIARNANLLALVVAAQQYPEPYYQEPKSHKSYAPPSKQSSSTGSHASTRYKGKEIAKPITPSESAFEEDSDPKQTQRDKDMDKNLALIAKYFKKIYQPTNNNLRTSLNTKNKNMDTSPSYKNDNVAGARETETKKGKRLHLSQGQDVVVQTSWERQYSEQPESINNTYIVEKDDSNVIPYSSNISDNDNQANQNAEECDDERVCKSTLEETNRTLGEYNRIRDRYLVTLHDKEVEVGKYKTFKDHTIENDTLERKLKETLGLLAQKEHDIKEGLKIKAYEIFVVKQKNDELVKQSLLTKSSYEGLLKEKNKVIKDLKLKEGHGLDKLIAVEKQLKFLNEIIYKRNQLIQTIHMLAPKSLTYNGRSTFANPMYLKKAQSEKPCLYEIQYGKDDLVNIFSPDREETLTLEQESRSKLNKDKVKPYDYTKQNSLYEIFKPPSREYLDQLVHANEHCYIIYRSFWHKQDEISKEKVEKSF